MNIVRYTLCLIAFVSFLFAGISGAASLKEHKEALKVISDFANEMCDKIPIKGKGENVELTGEARAGLNGLFKKLANIGIEGVADYQKSEYEGLLQKDLAATLKDSRNCKLEILNQLKSIIFTSNDDGDHVPSIINSSGILPRVVKSSRCKASPYTTILSDGSLSIGLHTTHQGEQYANVFVKNMSTESIKELSINKGKAGFYNHNGMPIYIKITYITECEVGYEIK